MNSKNKAKKTKKNDTEIWTEEQYDQCMKGHYGLNFIVGYTEGGVPYGIPLNLCDNGGEELPFI